MHRIMAALIGCGLALPALSEPSPEGVEVTWEVMAPRMKFVTFDHEDYITRKTRHTRSNNSISLEQIDGRDVLSFEYATGSRCALVLHPQPDPHTSLTDSKHFELRDGFVIKARRDDKLGGPCAALSHYTSDWDGELDLVLDKQGNIVIDLQLRSYGRDGRHTATLSGYDILAKRLVIDHAANARRNQESRAALAPLIMGALIQGFANPSGVTAGGDDDADARRARDFACKQAMAAGDGRDVERACGSW